MILFAVGSSPEVAGSFRERVLTVVFPFSFSRTGVLNVTLRMWIWRISPDEVETWIRPTEQGGNYFVLSASNSLRKPKLKQIVSTVQWQRGGARQRDLTNFLHSHSEGVACKCEEPWNKAWNE